MSDNDRDQNRSHQSSGRQAKAAGSGGSGDQMEDSTGTQVVREERGSAINRPSPRLSTQDRRESRREETSKNSSGSSEGSRNRRQELQSKRLKEQTVDFQDRMRGSNTDMRESAGMRASAGTRGSAGAMRESATSNLLRELEADEEDVINVHNFDDDGGNKTTERSQLEDLTKMHGKKHLSESRHISARGLMETDTVSQSATQGSKVTRMAVTTYNRVKQLQRTIRNPPWVASTPLQKIYLWLCEIGAIMPVFVLFGILFGTYFVYVWCYLREMMGIGGHMDGQGLYWDTQSEKDDNQVRGSIYWGILNWLVFWLMYCIILCIITEPGRIPTEDKWEGEENAARDTLGGERSALPQHSLSHLSRSGADDVASSLVQAQTSGRVVDTADSRTATGAAVVTTGADNSRGSGEHGISGGNSEGSLDDAHGMRRREVDVSSHDDRSKTKSGKSLSSRQESGQAGSGDAAAAAAAADLIERKRFGGRRYCQHCRKFKPDRTHHCRLCNKCILEMDHHCPWVANCIGFYNHKYFMLMVFYGMLTSWFVIATMYEALEENFDAESESDLKWFVLTVTYSQICLLGLAVTAFFAFHLWLLRNAFSTIEFCEKKRYGDSAYDQSPFDLGFSGNFVRVFGPNPFFWFFPFRRNLEGGGLTYRTTDEARERRRQEKMLSFNFLFFEDEESSSFVA